MVEKDLPGSSGVRSNCNTGIHTGVLTYIRNIAAIFLQAIAGQDSSSS